MVTVRVPDAAELLAPLPGPSPGGSDLRVELPPGALPSSLTALRRLAGDARALERRPYRTSEPGTSPVVAALPAEWGEVAARAVRILREESKDIEAAACFCEAQLRLAGLGGLRAGLQLVHDLVADYWEVLHPLPVPGNPASTRIAALRSLDRPDGAFLIRLRLTSILEAGLAEPLGLWHLERLDQLEQVQSLEERTAAYAKDKLPSPEEMKAALENSYEQLRETRDEAAGALGTADALNALLLERCGAAPLSNTRDVLASLLARLQDFVASIGKTRPQAEHALLQDATAPDGMPSTAAVPATVPLVAAGRLDREGALRLLTEISQFFRRTEPHSPLSYVLDQAIRWGHMPLPELMAELLPSGDARDTMFRLAGLSLGQR